MQEPPHAVCVRLGPTRQDQVCTHACISDQFWCAWSCTMLICLYSHNTPIIRTCNTTLFRTVALAKISNFLAVKLTHSLLHQASEDHVLLGKNASYLFQLMMMKTAPPMKKQIGFADRISMIRQLVQRFSSCVSNYRSVFSYAYYFFDMLRMSYWQNLR